MYTLLPSCIHSENVHKMLVVITFSRLLIHNMENVNQKPDIELQTYTGNSKCYVELFAFPYSSTNRCFRDCFSILSLMKTSFFRSEKVLPSIENLRDINFLEVHFYVANLMQNSLQESSTTTSADAGKAIFQTSNCYLFLEIKVK